MTIQFDSQFFGLIFAHLFQGALSELFIVKSESKTL